MRIIYFIGVILYLLFSNALNAQGKVAMRINDNKTTDWLEYDYQFIDENHQITATSEQFDDWKKEFRFQPDKPLNYADSLTVVLSEENMNAQERRQARLQLSYTWERASWYLLLSDEKTKEIAQNIQINYPYQLVETFRSFKRDNELIIELENRFKELDLDKETKGLSTKDLMKLAFQYSPGRLARVDEILAERGQTRRKDDH